MVDKKDRVLVFDGVKPEAVVFGDSLGEGKHQRKRLNFIICLFPTKTANFSYHFRCIRKCESRMVEESCRQKVRH